MFVQKQTFCLRETTLSAYVKTSILKYDKFRFSGNCRGKVPHLGVGGVQSTSPTPKCEVSHGNAHRTYLEAKLLEEV